MFAFSNAPPDCFFRISNEPLFAPSADISQEYLLGIAEEFDVEYTPALPVRRKSSADTEAAAAAAAAAAAGRQPAYEVPSRRSSSTTGAGGAGGGADAGSGISAPPPVTAWAVSPSAGIPLATATLSPQNSFGGDGAAGCGSGGGGGGGFSIPTDMPNEQGHYRDSSGTGAVRRASGGFEEATKGWGPSDAEEGVGGAAAAAGKGGDEDAPPPYSPRRKPNYDHNDIPSPPKTRPVTTYDIPAAPG